MGRGLARKLPRLKPATLLWACILGNNIPDIDVILRPGLSRLGYLFDHRGYTHTVTFAPIEGVLVAVVAALLTRVHRKLQARDWVMLTLVSTLSVLAHIAADFCNDYGVHPFSPFDSHWFYGGFLFILEPLIWAALIPIWIRTRAGQVAAVLFVLLLWFGPQLILPTRLICTAFFACMTLWQWKRPGLTPALTGLAVVVAAFLTGSRIVAEKVRSDIALSHPEETITQLVTTPSPGNPFCWRVIPVSKVEIAQPDAPIFERVGVYSVFPKIFPPRGCFKQIQELPTFLGPSTLTSTESMEWMAEFRSTREELFGLAANYCRFAQYLRFSRAPFWQKHGDQLLVSDLRYAGRGGASFARFIFEREEKCLEKAPRWEMPAGLL